jgi:hypothetical protein
MYISQTRRVHAALILNISGGEGRGLSGCNMEGPVRGTVTVPRGDKLVLILRGDMLVRDRRGIQTVHIPGAVPGHL